MGQILEELTVHTYLENEVMYPAVRKALPDLEADVLESYEEHHVADVLCMELATMSPDDEHFDAKTTVLIENVTHHIQEEEQDWFPKVRAGLSRKELQALGQVMVDTREKAPRKPFQPSALKKAIDPARPIQVIAIGIGDGANETALRRVTDLTGGGAFLASDPSRIGDVFLKAIPLRTTARR